MKTGNIIIVCKIAPGALLNELISINLTTSTSEF